MAAKLFATVSAPGLHLRVDSNDKSAWRDKLSRGDRLEVLDTRAGWFHVRVARTGQRGWVYSKYVNLDPPLVDVPTFDPGPDVPSYAGAIILAVTGLILVIGLTTCIGP